MVERLVHTEEVTGSMPVSPTRRKPGQSTCLDQDFPRQDGQPAAPPGNVGWRWEQAIEGTLAFLAVAVLTWMIFWMRRNSRNISSDLHAKIDAALNRSPLALAAISFVAVAREGFETALFLIGAETSASSGVAVVLGGFIGLVVSIIIGVAFYAGSARIDLRRFFQYTGFLLILFAAGLFAKGLHELLGIEWSLVSDTVWNVTSGPFAEGWTMHDFLKGLFGWSPNPERIRVASYLAYLVPVTWFFFRDPRNRSSPRMQVRSSASAAK